MLTNFDQIFFFLEGAGPKPSGWEQNSRSHPGGKVGRDLPENQGDDG